MAAYFQAAAREGEETVVVYRPVDRKRQKGTEPMKVLIVNDDSISAPGIAMLAKAAAELGEVWVVAPKHQCSAMSQKLTIHGDMLLEKAVDFPVQGVKAYCLEGTPVDCVKVALQHLMQEKPDFVFSGINNGYNTGYDIAYSGTLGAAFEAVRGGVPAIAFSAAGDAYLPGAEGYLPQLIKELTQAHQEPGKVWNVNFPAVKTSKPKGILRDVPLAPLSLFRETYIETVQPDGSVTVACKGILTPLDQIPEGTDSWAVKNGYISIGKVNGLVL